jgi:hypothetical protein
MTVKRFLILFILIAYSVVGCAGQNKEVMVFTKPDFSQDEYAKDRYECFIQSINQIQGSDDRWSAFADCLEKKGYEFKKAEEPPIGNKVTAKDIGLIALLIVLSPLILAYGVWLIGQPL